MPNRLLYTGIRYPYLPESSFCAAHIDLRNRPHRGTECQRKIEDAHIREQLHILAQPICVSGLAQSTRIE